MIEINKKVFWDLLRSRNIRPKNIDDNDDDDDDDDEEEEEDNNLQYYISDLVRVSPATWSFRPNSVGIVDVIMMRQGREKYFWESPDFILDRKLMELFHKRYVDDFKKFDSLKVYFTLLSYLYELCINSMPTKTKHNLSQQVYKSWSNIDHAHEDEDEDKDKDEDEDKDEDDDTPLLLISDAARVRLVKKAQKIGILEILPNWYTSFNIVNYLYQHDDIAAYVKEIYDIPGNGSFDHLSCVHYWIMHFEFIYNTFFTLCKEEEEKTY